MKIRDKQLNLKSIEITDLIKILKENGSLGKELMEESIKRSFSLLKKQPNVLNLQSPFIIIGDIHGQFYDLLNILERYSIESNNFLFLGDYVDRGQFCIEVLTLLMVLKIRYPNSVHLLRGNHESRTMTSQYSFKQQCCKKYSTDIYQKIIDWFKTLPIAAIIDGKYFCVHGGISPDFTGITQLQKIKRNIQIPQSGIMCDLLWSDPIDDDDQQWENNSIRGVSYFFSRTLASKFLKQNDFKMIIRAHQLQDQGYKFQQNIKYKNKTQTYSLTLFSAPNYCDRFQNKGAIAIIKNGLINIETFSQVAHPFVLPGHMNVFEWTLPYIKMYTDHFLKNIMRQKNRKRSDIQSMKQIVSEMQNYESLQFIRELFQKIVIEKNQSFPMNNKIEKQYIQIQKQQQKFMIEKQQKKNKENLHVPGPFNNKLAKLTPKILKPTIISLKSLKSDEQKSLRQKFFNS